MTVELSMSQWVIVYLIAFAAFLVVDGAWLILVMKPLFVDMLGDMLRQPISAAPAAGFYVFYVMGVMFFASAPALESGSWLEAALRGAALGLLAYGTYDMTNLSTLNGYKPSIAFLDAGWGAVVTALTGGVGFFAARWLSGA